MEQVLVILTLDAVPYQVLSFKGVHDEIYQEAEKQFLAICKEYIWNFDEYSQEDIDYILEKGYEIWGGDNSVLIHWI